MPAEPTVNLWPLLHLYPRLPTERYRVSVGTPDALPDEWAVAQDYYLTTVGNLPRLNTQKPEYFPPPDFLTGICVPHAILIVRRPWSVQLRSVVDHMQRVVPFRQGSDRDKTALASACSISVLNTIRDGIYRGEALGGRAPYAWSKLVLDLIECNPNTLRHYAGDIAYDARVLYRIARNIYAHVMDTRQELLPLLDLWHLVPEAPNLHRR